MNKKWFGNTIGIILICIGLLPYDFISNIIPLSKPSIQLDINRPTEEILSIVKPVNSLIYNKDDRTKLAVFNYVFSKRVSRYDISSQKLQDLYVLAAQNYFQNSFKDKYDNLDELIKQLLIKSVGDIDHIVTKDEKIRTSNIFGGLAWRLIK